MADEKVRDGMPERFWNRVNARGDCWLWEGAPHPSGYATLWMPGGPQYVHRLAYAYFKGPVPPGLHIDHLCRTKLCVNPLHLEAVSPGVNALRGAGPTSENMKKGACHRGHPLDYVRPDGKRRCRTCDREWKRAFRPSRARTA